MLKEFSVIKNAKGIVFRGNPVVLIIAGGILLFLVYAFYHLGFIIVTGYLPYEGSVMSVSRDWTDFFLSDDSDGYIIKVQGKDGRIFRRHISLFTLNPSGLSADDYIIKKEGFRQKPEKR